MYSLYQKSHSEKKEVIVSIIRNKDNFVSSVQNILTNIYKIEHTLVENNDDALKIQTDKNYKPGNYLLNANNALVLVTKQEIVRPGYLYNSTANETSKKYTWKLLTIEVPIASEITEETVIESISEITNQEVEIKVEDIVIEAISEVVSEVVSQ